MAKLPRLLCTMLERCKTGVAHNATGANLENGLITALLEIAPTTS